MKLEINGVYETITMINVSNAMITILMNSFSSFIIDMILFCVYKNSFGSYLFYMTLFLGFPLIILVLLMISFIYIPNS